MSPSINKNAPYKKYQCRYFDTESGRPLSSSCNQGASCRFVHPDDPNWPGLKCYPLPSRAKVSGSQPSWHKPDARDTSRHSASPPVRGNALVSQKELFATCKMESKSDYIFLKSGSCDNGENTRKKDSRLADLHHVASESQGHHTTENSSRRSLARYHRGNSTSDASKDGTLATMERLDESETSLTLSVASEAEAKTRSERFISMFRDVAMVSSQVIQDTALLDQEERKLQTFNEISATLSKISPSSAGAVAGPIADILLAHAKSKERLDENFRLLGAAWENVFNSLLAEFSQCLENRLQAALASVKNEAGIAVNQLKRRRRSISPERRSKDDGAKGNGGSGSSVHSTRENKRRKVAGSSRSSSPTSEYRQSRGDPNLRNAVVKITLDDILSQMKMKIDQQSTSLKLLSKENEQLKSQLQSPPRAPRTRLLEPSSSENSHVESSSSKKSSSHAYSERHSSSHRHTLRSDSKH
ncbi:hypothetical protein GYMLUDRAFT_666719 [Collybiopsis luxurians FD-317 M1]|uniref:C3H1-type domain-containing protein n=1 Tax=Collybiopsis luxurians FD-317 M1 TaxID=944289 RepID=A0A0D0CMM8_9AGAR|nr:hypothetical protein GYMLUDRAFT_666719 [Collybiopsis luxurians FD-317 M1]